MNYTLQPDALQIEQRRVVCCEEFREVGCSRFAIVAFAYHTNVRWHGDRTGLVTLSAPYGNESRNTRGMNNEQPTPRSFSVCRPMHVTIGPLS